MLWLVGAHCLERPCGRSKRLVVGLNCDSGISRLVVILSGFWGTCLETAQGIGSHKVWIPKEPELRSRKNCSFCVKHFKNTSILCKPLFGTRGTYDLHVWPFLLFKSCHTDHNHRPLDWATE